MFIFLIPRLSPLPGHGTQEAEHHHHIAEGEEGLGAAVQGIHISQLGAEAQFGDDRRGDGDGHEQQGELEAPQGKAGKGPHLARPPEKGQVGQQRQHEQRGWIEALQVLQQAGGEVAHG